MNGINRTISKLRWIWDEIRTHPARLLSLVSMSIIAGTITYAASYVPVGSLDFPQETPSVSEPSASPSDYVAQPESASPEPIHKARPVDRTRPRAEVTNNDVSGNTDEPKPVEETNKASELNPEPAPSTATNTQVVQPCTADPVPHCPGE